MGAHRRRREREVARDLFVASSRDVQFGDLVLTLAERWCRTELWPRHAHSPRPVAPRHRSTRIPAIVPGPGTQNNPRSWPPYVIRPTPAYAIGWIPRAAPSSQARHDRDRRVGRSADRRHVEGRMQFASPVWVKAWLPRPQRIRAVSAAPGSSRNARYLAQGSSNMSTRKSATFRYFRLAPIWLLSAFLWMPTVAYPIGFEVHKGSLTLNSFQFPSEAVGGRELMSGKVFIQTSPDGQLIGHLDRVTGAGVFMISCNIRLPSLISFGVRSFKTASTPRFFISRQDKLLVLFDVSNVRVPLPQVDDGTPPSEIKATTFYVLAYSISRSDVDELLNGTTDAVVTGKTVDLGRERYDRLVRSNSCR